MNWKHLLMGTATVTLLAACASTKPETAKTAPVDATPKSTAPVDQNAANQGKVAVDPLNDPNSPLAKRSVYFDFDSNVIKPEFKPLVDTHAAYLKANPEQKVVIQGNTDSRGSREYNLALGQRRAESLKKSMEVLGVKDKQLEAVSFGKEKPKAEGNSDAAYAENRRDDIVYQQK
ncbi:peptidoglycan-associated lipoprotein Pal [Paludibacterium paludis]|uniref:Peptidoglycan-associated lipoprotein n=1 Tax=Paludibacterium paludis TaxID=1225769 RepID=A0A918U827_9NEIS|nr:peptidoglycan-associated lipoprotein Pal [Paludibacterium paludis]GGY09635.1 peptidoglycan-associated lipoprotein [Paludibacterium paludis]